MVGGGTKEAWKKKVLNSNVNRVETKRDIQDSEIIPDLHLIVVLKSLKIKRQHDVEKISNVYTLPLRVTLCSSVIWIIFEHLNPCMLLKF